MTVNWTLVTGCDDVQPAAASALIVLGEIVGAGWFAGRSEEIVVAEVAVAEVPFVQYSRRSR